MEGLFGLNPWVWAIATVFCGFMYWRAAGRPGFRRKRKPTQREQTSPCAPKAAREEPLDYEIAQIELMTMPYREWRRKYGRKVRKGGSR